MQCSNFVIMLQTGTWCGVFILIQWRGIEVGVLLTPWKWPPHDASWLSPELYPGAWKIKKKHEMEITPNNALRETSCCCHSNKKSESRSLYLRRTWNVIMNTEILWEKMEQALKGKMFSAMNQEVNPSTGDYIHIEREIEMLEKMIKKEHQKK